MYFHLTVVYSLNQSEETAKLKPFFVNKNKFKPITLLLASVSGFNVIDVRILFALFLGLFFDSDIFLISFSNVYICIYAYVCHGAPSETRKGAISEGVFTRPKECLSAASAPLKYEFMMVESE